MKLFVEFLILILDVSCKPENLTNEFKPTEKLLPESRIISLPTIKSKEEEEITVETESMTGTSFSKATEITKPKSLPTAPKTNTLPSSAKIFSRNLFFFAVIILF